MEGLFGGVPGDRKVITIQETIVLRTTFTRGGFSLGS